jgi:hypothetical protein
MRPLQALLHCDWFSDLFGPCEASLVNCVAKVNAGNSVRWRDGGSAPIHWSNRASRAATASKSARTRDVGPFLSDRAQAAKLMSQTNVRSTTDQHRPRPCGVRRMASKGMT